MRRVLVPLSASALLPAAGGRVQQLAGASMGSSWSAQLVADQVHGLAGRIQAQLDQVVKQMSHWEASSQLSRFNGAPAGSWHALPPEFAAVLDYALQLAGQTGGAYDPAAGALVNCWGFGARQRYDEPGFEPPSQGAIDTLLAHRQALRRDASGRVLQPGGVQLDLSSIAKGFAVDQMARCLERAGHHHYLVEAGGELRGAGVKPDGTPWWVALEAPPGITDDTVLALHGLAVATSGDYRRNFEHGGQRLSHTLDPRSGRPIANQVASVSVLHPQCMAADALSTALSVLGPEAGLAYAEQHELAARFLVRRGAQVEEVCSSAFLAMLQ
ncbi:MAG: FAD:protein FMN transferase [Pseudomonadota bacterium]